MSHTVAAAGAANLRDSHDAREVNRLHNGGSPTKPPKAPSPWIAEHPDIFPEGEDPSMLGTTGTFGAFSGEDEGQGESDDYFESDGSSSWDEGDDDALAGGCSASG